MKSNFVIPRAYQRWSSHLIYSIEIYNHYLLHRKVEFEFRREFLLGIKAVREIYPSQAAVCMNLNSQCLNIVSSICSASKVSKIQLYLIPSLIHLQWHCTYEWFHSCHPLQQPGKGKEKRLNSRYHTFNGNFTIVCIGSIPI